MTEDPFTAWSIRADGAAPSRIDLHQDQSGRIGSDSVGTIVVYDDPKRALAQAVVNSGNPGKTLFDWAEIARLVVRLHRQNRSRTRLVQRPLTSLEESALGQLLEGLFDGSVLPPLSPRVAAEDEGAVAWAALALLASDERRLLSEELLAATTGGSSDALDADAALATLWSLHDAMRHRDLLLSQIDDLERQLLKVTDVRDRLWDEIKALKSRTKAETDSLRTKLATEREKRTAVQASTSWRITRPIRILGRLLKHGRVKRGRSSSGRVQN